MLALAGPNFAFFVLVLALHVLGVLVISPPWDRYIGMWVIANTIAFGANVLAIRIPNPKIVPPTCPYCKEILTVGVYRCPTHGNLNPEETP